MVTSITNYSRNGLSDWFLQRVTAVLMLAYAIFMLVVFASHPHMTFQVWQHLFASSYVKIFTLLTMGAIVIHAWIGLWIVFGDYVKCCYLRTVLQVATTLLLLSYFIWVIMIVWGVA